MINSRFAIKLALAFFVAGTALLALFYFDPSLKNAMLAYQFTIGAIIVNWLFALILLFAFLRRRLSLKELLTSLGVMAVNIPVGILYSAVMVWLLSYVRITVTNSSEDIINNVQLIGCETKKIDNLGIGQSETIWVKIKNGCDIFIEYNALQSNHREQVADSLVNGKGFKTTYSIK